MPTIKPFSGIIYNPLKIKKMASVVAPPYDIISPKQQDELHKKSPYNVVRLILGKKKPSDTSSDNQYTRAQRSFSRWLKESVLIRDREPALYVYVQTYNDGKKMIDRVGFIGRMQLDLSKRKKVLAHENTLAAPKADRLNLMRKVKANMSPIFVLFEDNGDKVTNVLRKCALMQRPCSDVTFEGVRNRIWKLKDRKALKAVEGLLKPKKTFIADGHHRYETACNFAREIESLKLPDSVKKSARYVMAYFVKVDEEMLTVMPAHRVVKDIGGLTAEQVLVRLKKFFDIEKSGSVKSLMKRLWVLRKKCAIGLYSGKRRFYVLKLKDPRIPDRIIGINSLDWRRLDVTILHLFVLKYVLSASDADDNIEFVKDPAETVSCVDKKKGKVAFFLNPTKVAQVKRIAQAGERMPRKATYFYPKPLTGLVINKFE